MNVPKLRFKEFDGEWEEYKLGSLGSVAMNKRIYKEETSSHGDIPFFKIGTFGGKADAFISRAKYEEYKEKYPYPQKGDLLISASGSIGRVIEYNGEEAYYQDSNIIWLKHDDRLDNLFLKQFYNIVRWSGIEGTTIKRLYNKNILETKINLPSIEEQRKIGEFFKELDNKIILQQQKIDLLQEQKKGFLQKMFPKAGETQPEMRFDGFTENWKECKLGDVSNIIGGGTPSTSIEEYWNGNINWYSPVEIGEQIYVYESRKKITEAGLKKSSARILPIGTVLFTSRAGIGNTAILAREGCTNQGFQSIVPLKEKLDSYFIFSRTEELKRYAEINGAGSTFVEISGKQMSKMPILLPDLKEQKKIGLFFKRLDDEIILQKTKLNFIQQQKQGFMQQMFI